jgi:RHS repeat-associated protein
MSGLNDAYRQLRRVRDANSESAFSWPGTRTKFGYDALDRLTSASTTAITDGWTYDADGNRLTQTGTTPSTFTLSPTSNQVTAISGSLVRTYGYNAAGMTTGYTGTTFSYNNRSRMMGVTTSAGSTSYLYNALGQLVSKSGSSSNLYVYDESGHILGEYDGTGNLIEETVWLGDIPVATLQPNGSGGINIFYVHTNHLNTPKKVTRPSDNALVWRIDQDPFGTAAPNQNPSGLGNFSYNLRFPGQLYMLETGLNYNFMRDYDPTVGRYIESDPIGQFGGVNTYAYVGENPLDGIDPWGLYNWHGNWCGPDWTGGFTRPFSELTANERRTVKPPIDQLDGACRKHDICYSHCSFDHPCEPAARSQCFRICDYTLTASAYAVGGFWGRTIGLAIDRPGTRDPGPNGSCCSSKK